MILHAEVTGITVVIVASICLVALVAYLLRKRR